MPVNWNIQKFDAPVKLNLGGFANQLNFNRQQARADKQNARQQSLADLELDTAERKAKITAKREDIWKQARGNPMRAGQIFQQEGMIDDVQQIQKDMQAQQKAQFENQQQQFDQKQKYNKRMGTLAGTVLSSKNPENEWGLMRQTAINEKLPNAEGWPEQYDPNIGNQLRSMYQNSMSPAERKEQQLMAKQVEMDSLNEKFRTEVMPTLDIEDLSKNQGAKNKLVMKINSSPYWNTPLAKETLKALKGKSSSLAEDLAKAMALQNVKGQNRPVPASQAVEIGGTAGAVADLNKLLDVIPKMEGESKWNPITDPLGGLNPWNTKAQAKKQYIASVKQTIGKGLEGGVMRAEDEKKYEKIIPKMGDTPETLQRKGKQLKDMILSKRKYMIQGLGSGGFDVADFENLNDPVPSKTFIGGSDRYEVIEP